MMKAQCVLTPSESKRLIAKGVVVLPEVAQARENGTIIISWGSTCACVVEELTGERIAWERYVAGYIGDGELKVSAGEDRIPPVVLQRGVRIDVHPKDALAAFGGHDVFIKGANAIDLDRNVGVLLQNDCGGTIGMALGILAARGSHLILPVGLEKLIPSVPDASNMCGLQTVDYATGTKVGLMPVMYGKTITEIDAVYLLSGADAVHIASGGLGDSQGATTLVIYGVAQKVERAIEIIEQIKDERR